MKISLILFFLISMTNFLQAEEVDCTAKKIQIMKPLYPYASYQGYAIVNFNVEKDGTVSNVRAIESQCAMSRNEDGTIKFKKCPFFKSKSVEAGTLIKYTAPKTSSGDSCTLKNETHRYIFSLYNPGINDLNFILRDEFVDLMDNAE